jgi:hypothetical protein
LQRRHKDAGHGALKKDGVKGVGYGNCSMFGSRVVTGGGLSWVKDDGTLEKRHAMETPRVIAPTLLYSVVRVLECL